MNENLLAALILFAFFSPLLFQLVVVFKEYRKQEKKISFKRIKKTLLVCFLVFLPFILGFLLLSHVNFLDYQRPIPYSRFNEITFENFRGFEFFKKTFYGSERFAYIVTTIETEVNDDSITVQALFHPSKSFVYNKHTNSKELFNHEMYHFKITEVFARRIKQKISNLNANSKHEIAAIIEQLNTEERAYQRKYDYDTFHSYVYKEQIKYQKEIDSLLDVLTKYIKPKIELHVKD